MSPSPVSPPGAGHGHWSPEVTWDTPQMAAMGETDIKWSLKDWSPMDRIFLADLLWIWGCLILERCWRESSGMRTNPGPGPAEFCANYRPNVVVILETDKSNTWHKKANKNRDLWQITARRHISPGRGQCPVWQINYEKFNGAAKRYFMLIN